jgi:hypothetical protein
MPADAIPHCGEVDDHALPLFLEPGAFLLGFRGVRQRGVVVVDLAERLGHPGVAELLGQQHVRHHRAQMGGDDVLDVVVEEVADRGVGDVEFAGGQRAAGLLAVAAERSSVLHAEIVRQPAVGRADDPVSDFVCTAAEFVAG